MFRNGFNLRLLLGIGIAAFSYFQYIAKTQVNEVTGKKQRINLTVEQEVRLGLQSAPEMAAQMGGLTANAQLANLVKGIGQKLVNGTDAKNSRYKFDFHVLADAQTVNAFALPGGQIFITEGLIRRFDRNDPRRFEGQLAGVLGHEIGHVIGRHSAQQMAKQELTQGLVQAFAVGSGDMNNAQLAAAVAQMANMKYGRDDELEADHFGVKYACDAGYDPHEMIRVMEILKEASGGRSTPEFQSTHPSPENRIAKIQSEIQKTTCLHKH
jgi:predicted Zn-dependent protease